MKLSIIQDNSLAYPDAVHYFSPSEAFPEYQFTHISPTPNPVYRAVRGCMRQVGLDSANVDTPAWNPLGEYIKPGDRVFVLCNFVYHRRWNETVDEFRSKCTHASVIRAVIDYALKAAGPEGHVSFGNAPLQSCEWEDVLRETGAQALIDFYAREQAPVAARDLRLYTTVRSTAGHVVSTLRGAESDSVTVDFTSQSILREVDSATVRYRVSDYDPDRIESFHYASKHIYCMNRRVLESDVVISVPKLKTHEKVGITCSVKGFVGAVAHKDSLAHHRAGAPEEGGDEYPNPSHLMSAVSALHDHVQRARDTANQRLSQCGHIIDRNVRRVAKRLGYVQAGAWHGNDTTWRMAVDLARILRYCEPNGDVQKVPIRRHLSLIDGIVAGEGDGPLASTPVESKTLIFGDDVAAVDWVASRIMGFEPSMLPIVHRLFDKHELPLSSLDDLTDAIIVLNDKAIATSALGDYYQYCFDPPSGWVGHCEAKNQTSDR